MIAFVNLMFSSCLKGGYLPSRPTLTKPCHDIHTQLHLADPISRHYVWHVLYGDLAGRSASAQPDYSRGCGAAADQK